MANNRFSRRHFFYGTLLAGAIPAGGFGRTPSLRRLGYKSPNEKLNIAAIGAGGRAAQDITGCASENITAYLPFNWRGFFDFGCGALGDMACHLLGAVNMALMLGAPTSVEVIQQEGKSLYYFPKKSVTRSTGTSSRKSARAGASLDAPWTEPSHLPDGGQRSAAMIE